MRRHTLTAQGITPQTIFHILSRPRLALIALVVVGFALSSCDQLTGSSTSTTSSSRSPDDLYYSSSPALYHINEKITTNTLVSSSTLKSVSVSPTLPSGLSLNSTDGSITGTPTTITAKAEYVVKATNSNGTGYARVVITVGDTLPTITYAGTKTLTYTVGSAISTITPTLGGGATTACSSSPALPAGLSLSPACVITGTPTTPVAAGNYTISANNTGGAATLVFNLTVKDIVPNISYPSASYGLYRTQSFTLAAINSGGAATSCSSTPSLPSGLNLSSTCAISGTPTAVTASAGYTITATNSGGTASTTVTLSVSEPAPIITYVTSSATLTVGTAMTALTATQSGGTPTSCTATLPSGLSINNTTCQISGTPTVVTGTNSYTVTATNATGSASATVTLTVNAVAPSISYSGSPFSYTKNVAISSVTPVNSGGTITSCTGSVPAGLSLSSTCVITGTPTNQAAITSYTITAHNSGGTSAATIQITVNDLAPSLSYSGSPYTYTNGIAISTSTPSNSGGSVSSCTASPTLPAGLSLNNTTCAISGTPTVVTAATNYTITGTNSAGSSAVTINITVRDTLPDFSYSGSPYSFTRGAAISTQTPTNIGGTITSCTATPSLPAGLSLSSTCVITGTPTVPQSATNYSIQGSNSAGSASTSVNITINESAPVISYAGSPFSFTINSAISAANVTNTGSAITSCSASGLPVGLSINATSCQITGTPTAVTAATNYTITATNASGSGSTTITITVKDIAPSIDYIPTTYNFIYAKDAAITPLTPNNHGGTITSCTASPALPAGLALSASDCTLSGTPTSLRTATDYTITAINSGGSSPATITLSVTDTGPSITYAGAPYTFTKNTTITTKTPTNTGGTITSCSVSPSFPSGLNLSTACVITGTPNVVTAATSYTITATNTGGNSFIAITIAVNDIIPSLSFSGGPYTYTKNSAIAAQTPTNTGGAITSCTSSPALPTGLSLSSTCILSGTPTVVSGTTTYTITGSNSGGSASDAISITVNDIAPNLSFAGSPYTYYKDNAISAVTPSNSGGTVISCASSPTLPSGLTLSSTCGITGTPTAVTATANYVITGTNSGGTSSKTVSITVAEAIPNISYSPSSYTETLRTSVGTLTPTNTGGTITSCSASPSLPTGMSLSSTCVITGAATLTSSSTAYTITATNAAGSATASITFTVKNQPQVLFYSKTALNLTWNGSAASSQNIFKIAADAADLTALTSNSNANLNSIAPSFTASGASIAYASKRALNGTTNGTAASSYNLWKSTAAGASSTALTSNSNASLDIEGTPSYSPDGTKIVFASKTATSGATDGTASGSYNIWIINADGTNKTWLTANSNAGLDSIQPVFSPDGSWVYFASKTALSYATDGTPAGSYNIWKIGTNGGGKESLTSESVAGRDSLEPRISPDGLSLIYSSMAQVGGSTANSYNIWKMGYDGSNKSYLTSNTSAGLDSRYPQFSNDGTEIVFSSLMDIAASASSSYNIWKMTSSGASQTYLTSNTAVSKDSITPTFSTDDSKIIFTSLMNVGATSSSSYNIWSINSNGTGQPTALTSNTNSGLDSYLGPGRIWYAE